MVALKECAGINRLTAYDPAGFVAGDQNLYRFVGDDPVSNLDPSGLKVRVAGKPVDEAYVRDFFKQYKSDYLNQIVDSLIKDDYVYDYTSAYQFERDIALRFAVLAYTSELDALRQTGQHTFNSKRFIDAEGAKSWRQNNRLAGPEGAEYPGLSIKEGVSPFEAIKELFSPGVKVSYDCQQAFQLALLRGLADALMSDEERKQGGKSSRLFDEIFKNRLNLAADKVDQYIANNIFVKRKPIPGDRVGFRNPDYDPKNYAYQNEGSAPIVRIS